MNAARWLLTPLSGLYGAGIRARNLYYDHVSGAVQCAAVPVISVGNLTVGGTGKTPFVIEVVERLRRLGRRPAILTRGYRAAPGEVADEVREFHEALPEVPVVANPDRVAGAATAVAQHAADCLVLDDGFQHRHLGRTLDMVLIDALEPWGGGWVLPAGRLREPLSSLRRADVFVITRANQVAPAAVQALAAILRACAGDQPVLCSGVEPVVLVGRDGRRAPPVELAGQRVLGVCGIGNPRTFTGLVSALTGAAQATLVFGDHTRYGMRELERIVAAARSAEAKMVVTTRKDWVKLARLWPGTAPELLRLDVRIVLLEGEQELDARLRRAVASAEVEAVGRMEKQR
jgi:tetraacyldisaccharide 4'-kinase